MMRGILPAPRILSWERIILVWPGRLRLLVLLGGLLTEEAIGKEDFIADLATKKSK